MVYVLTHARHITVRRNNCFGGYFRKFFGLRLILQFALVLIQVSVLIDKVEHIVTAAAGRVAEIDHGNFVAVIFFGYSSCVTVEIVE